MWNSAKESPGLWFTCMNVGDDYEEKDDRRDDIDLIIPDHSLVEIVGVRTFNADHFVLEVRLPVGGYAPGQSSGEARYVTARRNYAFTGPKVIPKGYQGRLTFPPCLCRFEGEVTDTSKIHGRYIRPEKSELSDATLDLYESLFGKGVLQRLIGDPKGHLKLPDAQVS